MAEQAGIEPAPLPTGRPSTGLFRTAPNFTELLLLSHVKAGVVTTKESALMVPAGIEPATPRLHGLGLYQQRSGTELSAPASGELPFPLRQHSEMKEKPVRAGGANRDRTGGLRRGKAALCQLSYCPISPPIGGGCYWFFISRMMTTASLPRACPVQRGVSG